MVLLTLLRELDALGDLEKPIVKFLNRYNNFDIILGPFLAFLSSTPPQTKCAVWHDLLGAHADRGLIGAWNPML